MEETEIYSELLTLTEYSQEQYDRVFKSFRDLTLIDLESAFEYAENSLAYKVGKDVLKCKIWK